MVSKKSDYHFVSSLDDIVIDGSIMPLREDKNICRGEDIAFLGEAVYECNYLFFNGYAGIGDKTISMEDTRLLAERPRKIAQTIKNMATSNAFWSSGKEITNLHNLWEGDYAGNYRPTAEEIDEILSSICNPLKVNIKISSNMDDFQKGNIVELQPILNLFDDVSQFKATITKETPTFSNFEYQKEVWGNAQLSSVGDVFPYVFNLHDGTPSTAYRNYLEEGGESIDESDWSAYKCETINAEISDDFPIELSSLSGTEMRKTFYLVVKSSVLQSGKLRTHWNENTGWFDEEGGFPGLYKTYVDLVKIPMNFNRETHKWHCQYSEIKQQLKTIRDIHGFKEPTNPIGDNYGNYRVQQTFQVVSEILKTGFSQTIRGNHTLYVI